MNYRKITKDILDFVKANKIQYFCELCDYAAENNWKWFQVICDRPYPFVLYFDSNADYF